MPPAQLCRGTHRFQDRSEQIRTNCLIYNISLDLNARLFPSYFDSEIKCLQTSMILFPTNVKLPFSPPASQVQDHIQGYFQQHSYS